MRLLIMGPPGAGKGTQAQAISDRYGIPAISTGMMFRLNITNRTPLGEQIKRLISNGEFVPDAITEKMLFNRLGEQDVSHGWLLDGFPRTLSQVRSLDAVLAYAGTNLDAAIVLTAPPEALVERMLRRAEIEGRDDDNEYTIRHRIDVYQRETDPLIELYNGRDLLVEVDAMGTVEEVQQRLQSALTAKVGGE